jgi:hypothetical protein
MRSKNFFKASTGHKTTDAYLKYAPIHTDSDVLGVILTSFFLGVVSGFFLFMMVGT